MLAPNACDWPCKSLSVAAHSPARGFPCVHRLALGYNSWQQGWLWGKKTWVVSEVGGEGREGGTLSPARLAKAPKLPGPKFPTQLSALGECLKGARVPFFLCPLLPKSCSSWVPFFPGPLLPGSLLPGSFHPGSVLPRSLTSSSSKPPPHLLGRHHF